jgi:hypothetical protein
VVLRDQLFFLMWAGRAHIPASNNQKVELLTPNHQAQKAN